MNMICNTSDAVTIATGVSTNRSDIGMEIRANRFMDERATFSSAKNDVDDYKT